MRALNSVGYSINSEYYSVTTTKVPSAPSTFITDAQNFASITISWTEPANGGQSISDYQVDWNQGSSTNTWTPLASTTSGATTFTKNGLGD